MTSEYVYDPDRIWDLLMKKTGNVAGASAIMPCIAVATDLDFAEKIDKGEVTMEQLRKSRRQLGLGRWTRWEDKQGLYNLSKKRGVSITDLEMQIDFLWEDIGREKYGDLKKQLMVANDVEKLCERFLKEYIGDAKRTPEQVKERTDLAKDFYDQHTKKEVEVKYLRILKGNVPIRKTASFVGRKIGVANKDDEFQFLISSKSGNWHSVCFEGRIGWISAKYGEFITRTQPLEGYTDVNCQMYC